jgi:hypothetical protein
VRRDFLTRLGERAVGGAGFPRPNVAPLFAKGAELAGDDVDISETASAVEAVPARPPDTLDVKPSSRESVSVPAQVQPPVREPRRRTASEPQPPEPRRRRSTARPAVDTKVEQVSPSRRLEEQRTIVVRPATPARAEPQPIPPRPVSVLPGPPAPRPELRSAARPQAPRPVTAAVPTRPAASDRAVDPAEPDVLVTIGRIDVHAAGSPVPVAPPQPRPQATPAVTLEDYLRARSGAR